MEDKCSAEKKSAQQRRKQNSSTEQRSIVFVGHRNTTKNTGLGQLILVYVQHMTLITAVSSWHRVMSRAVCLIDLTCSFLFLRWHLAAGNPPVGRIMGLWAGHREESGWGPRFQWQRPNRYTCRRMILDIHRHCTRFIWSHTLSPPLVVLQHSSTAVTSLTVVSTKIVTRNNS